MQLTRKATGNRISEAELEKLIDKYEAPLLKHAFFVTGSFQEAQDIVQEAFVKFYHQPPALHKASKTGSYLYRMVNNAAIDFIRKNKGKRIDIGQVSNLPDEKHNGSKRKMELHNEYLRISKLLDQIPEEQAMVIRMRTISDLSFVEIARILELPVTTVKSRFAYGIDKLRKKTGQKKEVYDEL